MKTPNLPRSQIAQFQIPAVLGLICLTLLVPTRVHALDGTWTNTGSLGTWTTTTNWASGTVAGGSGYTANFTSNITTQTTITLNGNRTIGNLNFGDATPSGPHNWIITGDTLTLQSGSAPTVHTQDANGRINSNLTAAAGFTKTGSGNFVISGASNNIDGTVLINAGVIAFGHASAGAGTDGAAFNLAVSGTQITVSTEGTGVGQTFQLGSLTGVAGTTLRNAGGITGTNTFAIGALGTNTEFAGNIVDADFDTLTAITKVGSGTLILSGANTYIGNTIVSAGTLVVNSTIAASASVSIAAGATLGGSGSVSAISGAGTVGPGNSPGILTALSLNGTAGLDFAFELTALAPNYLDAADSLNDVLRLTAGTPFTMALTASNTVTVDFSSLSLAIGQTYFGGFYADSGDFASAISGANFVFTGASGFNILVSTVQQTANFGSGNVGGWVTQFDVVAIPEPSTPLLLAAGLMAILYRRRSRA